MATEDKVLSDNGLVRTLAATAMELRRESMNTADVILAVNLPFTDHRSHKQKLIGYYMAHRWLDYTYENEAL